mmetsp:Transcript_2999/g.9705  ORF Transcript_2999/g.9705 Transcript_2999/m.9705 type:complete len:242 (-) Transcript_2999:500-1225(-)
MIRSAEESRKGSAVLEPCRTARGQTPTVRPALSCRSPALSASLSTPSSSAPGRARCARCAKTQRMARRYVPTPHMGSSTRMAEVLRTPSADALASSSRMSAARCATQSATVSSARDRMAPFSTASDAKRQGLPGLRTPSSISSGLPPSDDRPLVSEAARHLSMPSDKYTTSSTSKPVRSTTGPAVQHSASDTEPTPAIASPMTGTTSGALYRVFRWLRCTVTRHLLNFLRRLRHRFAKRRA